MNQPTNHLAVLGEVASNLGQLSKTTNDAVMRIALVGMANTITATIAFMSGNIDASSVGNRPTRTLNPNYVASGKLRDKTECKYGHDLTLPNSIYTNTKTDQDACRECLRIATKEHYLRHRKGRRSQR